MGVFTRKIKRTANVSSASMFPEKRPSALRDAIQEYVFAESGTVKFEDRFFANIEKSFARNYNKFYTYVSNYTEWQSTIGTISSRYLDVSDAELQVLIQDYISTNGYVNSSMLYTSYKKMDYAHFLRIILKDDFSLTPDNKLLSLIFETSYLVDAVIYCKDINNTEEYSGASFNSGKTLTRTLDLTRAWTPWIVDNTITHPYALVTLQIYVVKEYTEFTYEDYVYNTTTSAWDYTGSSTNTTTTVNPNTTGFISAGTTSTTTTYTNTSGNTKQEVTEINYVENFIKDAVYTITLENFVPKEIDVNLLPEVGGTHDAAALAQHKLDLNQSEYSNDYTKSDYLIMFGFTHKVAGVTQFGFVTVKDTDSNNITAALNINTSLGNYSPRCYFMIDNDIIHNRDSTGVYHTGIKKDLYDVNNRVLKKLDLHLRNLSRELFSEVDDEDLEKLKEVYFTFAATINRKTNANIKYCYYFTEKWFDASRPSNYPGVRSAFTIKFKDNYTETKLSADRFVRRTSSSQLTKDITTPTGTATVNCDWKVETSSDSVTFYKGNDSGIGYVSYSIYDLERADYIAEGTWGKLTGDGDKIASFPVDYDIVRQHFKSFKERESLLYRSACLEFTSFVAQKEEWYETNLFKAFVFVASVVIGVFTGGVGFSLGSVVQSVVTNALVGLAIDVTIRLIVENFDLETAKILAIGIAIIGVVVGSHEALQVGNSFMKAGTIFLMNASKYWNVANKILVGETEQLQLEAQEEQADHNKFMQDLSDMSEDSGQTMDSGIRSYIDSRVKMGTTPEQFMNQGHQNSIETVINYPQVYADYIIKLPDMDETLARLRRE